MLTQTLREEQERPRSSLRLSLFRRLFAYSRPYAGQRNILLLIVITRSVQLPALAWVIGLVLSGPVTSMNTAGIILGAAAYGALAVFTQWTMRYRMRLALELGENVLADIRNDMFAHLQTMPMSFFAKTRMGRIISRFISDAEMLRVGIQDVLFVSLVQFGQMVIAAGLMLWYDSFLFLIVAAMAPVLWVFNRHFGLLLSESYRVIQENFSRVTATLVESVSGVRVTQGFARQNVNSGMFRQLVYDHSQYNVDVARTSGIFIPLLEFNSQFFVALVLFVGGWRVLNGLSPVEDLYQFILMSNMFFAPVQGLGMQFNNALTSMASAERVFGFLDTRPDWSDPPDAEDVSDVQGYIRFDNVTFGYDPSKPVLNDINFEVRPGQTAAIVGHTGSGKTSIINLIPKFHLPGSGRVLIDGKDVLKISTSSLRRRIGIVLQQSFLFSGTVLDNIRLGNDHITDEDIIEAARKLDCLDIIESLPDGFSTAVTEKGGGISLGQRQLICFTRALLADPRILILDEATSSVDTLTELRIQNALARLLKNRTSMVVAHRLSTIRNADIVLVVSNGRIIEKGTHDELLQLDGHYCELYREFIKTV